MGVVSPAGKPRAANHAVISGRVLLLLWIVDGASK
jgi:hypothetical protein